jgi:hypothetical protein
MALRMVRAIVLVGLVGTFATTGNSNPPANLLDALFGSNVPTVTRVVVARINPWINRMLTPSPHSFENGESVGDLRAILDDAGWIAQVEDDLRSTNIISNTEGCRGKAADPESMYVSWAILFYDDQTRVAEAYITSDGLCASTGTHLYAVDPQGIARDLKRQFSFMNY